MKKRMIQMVMCLTLLAVAVVSTGCARSEGLTGDIQQHERHERGIDSQTNDY